MDDEKNILTTLKILIVGESSVGKSCLMLRFTDDLFDEKLPNTIGIDFKMKLHEIDSYFVKLNIWDTAGQERFRTLTPSYYRGAHGAILVYDITNRNTFKKLDTWVEELSVYNSNQNVVKLVVGNKVDEEDRVVSREEGLNYAKKIRALFVETSAKTSEGVENAFQELVRKILETDNLWEQNKYAKYINLEGDRNASGSSCSC